NEPEAPSPMNPALPDDVREACIRLGDEATQLLCRRILRAAWATTHMAAARRDLEPPSFLTPDDSVATSTILGYPSVQCRLDTMAAGVFLQERPSCWFASP